MLIQAVPAWAATLEQFRVNPLTGEQLLLELEFDGPVPAVSELLRQQPDRLVLQLPGTVSALAQNLIPIERQGVGMVDIRRIGTNLEVAVGLDRRQPYRISTEGNRLQLLLGEQVAGQDGAGASLPPGTINILTGVDFRRGHDGQGQVLISLGQSTAAVDMQVRGNRLVASFHNTHIEDDQLQTYDVTDFATPVRQVAASRERDRALVTVETDGPFEYRYDQSERMFVLEVSRPAAPASAAPDTGKRYGGKPISMNFQDIPVRTVLQLIADFNNFNLVTTDSVQGNITLRLDGVPWEQALDTILQVRGLDKRLEGNILLVAPAAELAGQERQQLENRQAQEVLAPLVTEFLQVNYAKAADIQALLVGEGRSSTHRDGAPENERATTSSAGRLVSERGSVAIDERTNILMIKDTRESIENIRRLLGLLDVPIKQVVIEARMVSVSEGLDEALGIRWSYFDSNMGNDKIRDLGFNVNLPIANPAGTLELQLAKLSDGRILDLELQALEKENRAEIIASPRVATSSQQQAEIRQGVQIPYTTVDDKGVVKTAFAPAELSLTVTPLITPDNRLVLDLEVTQNTVGALVSVAGGGQAPSINTQSVKTQLLVNDGETLVLGGIFQQLTQSGVTKIPVLGDIPVVGNLFKSREEKHEKRELLIFVTPRIAQ
ncbi:type IV pilus secretin PilQ [Zobellella taiwanensis]|uniref:Type IV pilus secretin PilQ n=2 Tax=Zobellella taiwanensis TaxID=347535 RepID=A0A2P7R4F8_9GAMM|nr:type IV pilus secretin PilQ [Zobellella taiwanensis]